jgi:hypothetical protein
MQENTVVDTHVEPSQILLLGFGDDMNDELEEYTPVVSKRTKKTKIY